MFGYSVLNAIQAALYFPIVITIGTLATGIALVAGGMQVVGGVITAGTLVAFLTYSRHFFEPVEVLAAWFAELQMAQASAERIISLIEAEATIQDSDQVKAAMQKSRAMNSPVAIDGYDSAIRAIEMYPVRRMSCPYLRSLAPTSGEGGPRTSRGPLRGSRCSA